MRFFPKLNYLLVEDLEPMRKALSLCLHSYGAESVIEAENGREAWNHLDSNRLIHPPQFIIADWSMPVLDGLELLALCKNDDVFRTVPFLLVTSEGHNENLIQAFRRGADGYIKKPFPNEMLRNKIVSMWLQTQIKRASKSE